MNIIQRLNYLDVKWSSRFRYVVTVRCQIRAQNTNKWSSAILAALRPFGKTPGTLTEGYKRLRKGFTPPSLTFTSVKPLSVSINQVRCVFLSEETERERGADQKSQRGGKSAEEGDVSGLSG